MTPARLRLSIIIGATILVLCWFLWWSGTSVQADRTFAHVKSAIENGRAGGVLDNLHRDYDFKTAWPNQFGGEASDVTDAIAAPTVRLLVQRGLTGLLQLQTADPFVFRYTIARIEDQDDGTVAVTVSIGLTTTSGSRPLTFTPSLTNQRFILARDGWWPALYVKSHPAFAVAY